jgi:hypothetical protein
LELFCSFNQRRPHLRPLSSFSPQNSGLLDQSGFGAVARQQLGLIFGNLSELSFTDVSDASVQRASGLRIAEVD